MLTTIRKEKSLISDNASKSFKDYKATLQVSNFRLPISNAQYKILAAFSLFLSSIYAIEPIAKYTSLMTSFVC